MLEIKRLEENFLPGAAMAGSGKCGVDGSEMK